jgi:hypothetical protein
MYRVCVCIIFIYIQIYTRVKKIQKLRRFCPFTRCALVTYESMVDGVRLLQWRSSAEDGDIKRTCAIQDNGRNENQRPKVAVVPSSATRPCRFASPRRGRVSRNSCADERGRRFSIIGGTRDREKKSASRSRTQSRTIKKKRRHRFIA